MQGWYLLWWSVPKGPQRELLRYLLGRVLNRKKWQLGLTVLFQNCFLLGVKSILSYAHKTGSWYLLRVLFKICDKHSFPFYMGVPYTQGQHWFKSVIQGRSGCNFDSWALMPIQLMIWDISPVLFSPLTNHPSFPAPTFPWYYAQNSWLSCLLLMGSQKCLLLLLWLLLLLLSLLLLPRLLR